MALNGTDLKLKCVAPCVFAVGTEIAMAAYVVVVAVLSIAVAIAIAIITAVAAAAAAAAAATSPACRPRRNPASSCNGYSSGAFTTVVILTLLPVCVLLVLSPHGLNICVVRLVNLQPIAGIKVGNRRWRRGKGVSWQRSGRARRRRRKKKKNLSKPAT